MTTSTDELVATGERADLQQALDTQRGLLRRTVAQQLPPAPWFAPGASWSARRVVAHILSETAQHCGHADILREAIDGQKSMG